VLVVDCAEVLFPKRTNRRTIGPRADLCGVAQSRIAAHNPSDHYVGMSTYRHSEEDERRIVRCGACDAMVFAENAGLGRADANPVCALCGMTLVDLPFDDCDYFDYGVPPSTVPTRVVICER
jgi:hypothetical protein